MGFVIIGNPESPRIEGFQRALASLDQQPARVITYRDLLTGFKCLRDEVRAGDVVRLESPGRNWDVERSLLELGADVKDPEDPGGNFKRISSKEVCTLKYDKGRLLPSRQWYLGWQALLKSIASGLMDCPSHQVMNAPCEIAEMFNKPRCHEKLNSESVPVPRSLGVIDSFTDLSMKMQTSGFRRIFAKLAHGSSASGIVAYRTNGVHHEAVTTVEVVRVSGKLLLYNSRRIRVLRDLREIAEIIDELCRHRVHVEEWLPKAGLNERTFDLRIVVIAGRARHAIVRLGRSAMTNLHLLNERCDPYLLRDKIPGDAWEKALHSCEKAMRLYPRSFCGGVDLMFTSDYKRHAILELNAFGDLLPGVLCGGLDTYQSQIQTLHDEWYLDEQLLEKR